MPIARSDAPRSGSLPQKPGFTFRGVGFRAGAALLVVACSAKGTDPTATDLPPACDAFVAKYEQCIAASAPSLPALAKQRAAQTRDALEKEVARASAIPAPAGSGATALTALVTKCNDNLQRLTTSCGSSKTN